MATSPERTCPSAEAAVGSLLVAVRDPQGNLAYVTPAPRVDVDLLSAARERFGDPRAALRFGAPCVRGACMQWTGSRCGVIDNVVADLGAREPDRLPACGIRSTCRWFAQHGRHACAVCPDVVTQPAALP
jgi:hypothetical protein